MFAWRKILWSALPAGFASLALALPLAAGTGPWPLQLHRDQRHLAWQDGSPTLLIADSPWSLIVGLTRDEAIRYLDDRSARGFNALVVNLIEHHSGGIANTFGAPHNRNGDPPFLKPGDFSTPNPVYFDHAAEIIQLAAARGMTVFLAPAYLGYPNTEEGWYDEVLQNGDAACGHYGRWVGERFKGEPNIIWMMYGDRGAGAADSMMDAMAQGLREADGTHLITAHLRRGQSTHIHLADREWLDFDTVYTRDVTQTACLENYQQKPSRPFFLIEARYEDQKTPVETVRRQAYTALLAGACGQAYGNDPLWKFEAGWQQALGSAGAVSIQNLRALFHSRNWAALVPDLYHSVITSGYGFSSNWVACACTSDGSTIIAYLPQSSPTILVDMWRIGGNEAVGWWFDPRDGSATRIGTFPTKGIRSFSRPDANDWVLVLDNASLSLPPPGTAPFPAGGPGAH